MTNCTFCGEPVTTGAAVHWQCGGILPDNPRDAAVAVADHLVRLLSPKRKFTGSAYRRQPQEPLTRDSLRARLRPELVEHVDDGVELALAARRIEVDARGVITLAPRAVSRPQRDDAEGLFDLPPDARKA